jgi:hypothetical protein
MEMVGFRVRYNFGGLATPRMWASGVSYNTEAHSVVRLHFSATCVTQQWRSETDVMNVDGGSAGDIVQHSYEYDKIHDGDRAASK